MKFLRVWQFKNDRNPDFGIQSLPANQITDGIMDSNLNINSLPEYCCGDQPIYSNYDNDLLIVHNASTFDQWFQLVIENGDYCRNFEHLIPVNIIYNDDYGANITIFYDNIKATLDGNGFNNLTKYPEYTDDPDKYLFCYSLELYIDAAFPNTLEITVQAPGEYWIFGDDVLLLQRGGVSYFDSSPYSFSTLVSKINIFGCTRTNYLKTISYTISNYNVSCMIDPVCGTCDSVGCGVAGCDDDITSCSQIAPGCGVCLITGRNCDDDDPCTVDYCTEGLGCQHDIPDPNCYCNDENCITADACFPRYCSDLHNCTTDPVICVGNLTCFEPHCQFGECVCSTQPVTIDTTTLSTLSTISTTTILSTSATTSSVSSTTFSTSATITLSTSATATSSVSSTTSPNPPPLFICDVESCPHHYCCIQLHKSYTCVSKYFEEQCNPSNLKEYF